MKSLNTATYLLTHLGSEFGSGFTQHEDRASETNIQAARETGGSINTKPALTDVYLNKRQRGAEHSGFGQAWLLRSVTRAKVPVIDLSIRWPCYVIVELEML